MKKKITALCLCVALLAIAVVGASLAYFTDTDNAKNTFTVGNVKIDLIESKYHRQGFEGSSDTTIPDPAQPANGMKYVGDGQLAFTDEEIQKDAETYQDYLKEKGANMVPGRSVAKCPYVINTGVNDAFIRIRVLIPAKGDNNYVDVKDGGVISSQWCSTAVEWGGEFKGARADFPKVSEVERNGVTYTAYTFIRRDALKPNEMTEWNVWNNIGIAAEATSTDIEKAIENGAIIKEADGTLKINVLVEADAIQADGFEPEYTAAGKVKTLAAVKAFEAFDAQNAANP